MSIQDHETNVCSAKPSGDEPMMWFMGGQLRSKSDGWRQIGKIERISVGARMPCIVKDCAAYIE